MSDQPGRPALRPMRLVVVVAVGLLVGCSSSPAPSTSAAGSGSDDLAAQVAATAALSSEESEAMLRTSSASVEGTMVTLSGLSEELGGAEQAQAAYTAMTTAMVTRTSQFRSTPGYVGRFGAHVRTDDAPSLGGMIFAGWMIGGLVADGLATSSNDATPGAEPVRDVKNDDQGTSTSSMVREASLESASMDWTVATTANGVTGKTRVKITVKPCPDPTGEFVATASISASATTAAGRAGSNSTVDIALTGRVDDDAKLAGYDVATTSQAAEFGSGNNIWAEATDRVSFVGGKVTAASRTFGRSSGDVPAGFAEEWANLGRLTTAMLANRMLSGAQKAWESGRCVSLVPTTDPGKRTGLAPSATAQILAAPRSKIDGSPTGGTVTATLAGDSSVTPSGSGVPADATFAYVAPGEKDKAATVALEARSKRGVARAEVAFDTKARGYAASGKAGNIAFSGTVADLSQPFTISGAGGARLRFSYVPSGADGRSGSMTYTGNVGGFKLTGGGNYTITGPEGGVLVLTQSIDGCAAGSLTCIGGKARITLTPAA